MIDSMTGFGRGEASVDNVSATVELRSVNNRYCEVSVRLPRSIGERESDVQARIKERFSRGRISAQIQVETSSDDILEIEVDPEGVRAYMNLLNRVRAAAGIEAPVRLDHLLNYSDIFQTAEPPEDQAETIWDAVQQALDVAIATLAEMRRQEGSALLADLEQRIDAIGRHLKRVEERAPVRVEEARQRLQDRLREIMDDDRIDRDRLEMEMAVVADRVDITEECVRLRSHLELFRQALNSANPEGRKLNFISQEINREVNTIGAKANDSEIAHIAVEMKDELEKVREQVQNVE